MTFGNGTIQNYVMNDRLQMESQELKRGSEVLQKYAYNYGELDGNGVLKNNGKLDQIESFIGANKQWKQKFSYDSIGRLEKETEYRGDNNAQVYQQKFSYDRFGNRYLKQTENSSSQNPLYPSFIEATDISKTNNQFTTGTTYDDAGNVTQDAKFRGLNYWYDANGRMYKTTTISPVNQSNSVYDASGQRVATQVDGVWTFFIYDISGKKVAEYGGLQATDEGGVKYVLQDYQGSSRAIVSNSGYINARMDYIAFGEEIQSNIGQRTAQGYGSSNTLNQKYALTERDKATGLDHTWFRKLENQAGRWTSPDPYNGSMSLGDPQSFNRYSYVENDPINFVDPSGLLMYEPRRQQSWLEMCWLLGICGNPNTGTGGGEEFPSGGGNSGSPPPQEKCDPGYFDPSQTYKVNDGSGRSFAGTDLNYAARVIFAEAASMFVREKDKSTGNYDWNVRSDYKQEFDAVASVLYNRIGASGFSGGVQSTFQGVANAPNQFKAVGKPKFNSADEGSYQNLKSTKGITKTTTKQNGRLPYFALDPGDCDNLKEATSALRRLLSNGPAYNYTYNRAGTSGRGTVHGGSRFWR